MSICQSPVWPVEKSTNIQAWLALILFRSATVLRAGNRKNECRSYHLEHYGLKGKQSNGLPVTCGIALSVHTEGSSALGPNNER